MATRSDMRGPASLAQYAYHRESGERVERGEVMDHDGWVYVGVDRPAYGNSSGRVAVVRPCPDAVDGECVHMWHRGGVERREFFPSVFGLYLGDVDGNEA